MCIKKNVLQKCSTAVRPIRPVLNRMTIEELLGEKFSNVVMYYVGTNKLNRKFYNESAVIGLKEISCAISQIKQDCAKSSELCNRELVAVFAKTVDCNYANWFANRVFFRVPPYDTKGKCIAGNVILFNKENGKYESMPRGWFYTAGKICRGSASEESIMSVAKVLKDEKSEILDHEFYRQRISRGR